MSKNYEIIVDDIVQNPVKFYEALNSLFSGHKIGVDTCIYDDYYDGKFEEFDVADFIICEITDTTKIKDIIGNIKILGLDEAEKSSEEKYHTCWAAVKKDVGTRLVFLANLKESKFVKESFIKSEDGSYQICEFDRKTGELDYFPSLRIKYVSEK